MKGFIADIEKMARENEYFRKVLYTAKNSQLVLMALKPKEEIGEEVHHLDQFLRIEEGEGFAILNGVSTPIRDGSAIVVPAGTKHNVVNGSATRAMKLYTVYSPPEHIDGKVHATKAEAMADTGDEFDGKTTEE